MAEQKQVNEQSNNNPMHANVSSGPKVTPNSTLPRYLLVNNACEDLVLVYYLGKVAVHKARPLALSRS